MRFCVNGLRSVGSVLFLQLLNITNRFSVLGCLKKASQNAVLLPKPCHFSQGNTVYLGSDLLRNAISNKLAKMPAIPRKNGTAI